MNAKKTKSMFYNTEPVEMTTIDGNEIKQAIVEATQEQDFNYLGSWVDSKERDISARKAMAWQALNKMNNIWKSNLSRTIKLLLFLATVVSILLYGSETWSLTVADEKRLDGTYTRMLRQVLNISWKDKITNKELYGEAEKLSSIIQRRRLKLAGHVYRDENSPARHLVTWIPKHGHTTKGRPTGTYIDTLLRDTGLHDVNELEKCMGDRDVWRQFSSRRRQDADRK